MPLSVLQMMRPSDGRALQIARAEVQNPDLTQSRMLREAGSGVNLEELRMSLSLVRPRGDG